MKLYSPGAVTTQMHILLSIYCMHTDILIQYEKRPTCNCSTVDLGEISRAFLWETYGRKVRAGPECMQATRGQLCNALGWLPGARAGGFQPVTQWGNVGNHARAAFSL